MQDKHAAHPFRYIEICIYNWQLFRKLNKPKYDQILLFIYKIWEKIFFERFSSWKKGSYTRSRSWSQMITLPVLIPDKERKNNLKILIFTLLCDASKGFMKAFEVSIKPFETPQRSVTIKISVNFYFYITFWNVQGWKGSFHRGSLVVNDLLFYKKI